jgi:hypothetical protein
MPSVVMATGGRMRLSAPLPPKPHKSNAAKTNYRLVEKSHLPKRL